MDEGVSLSLGPAEFRKCEGGEIASAMVVVSNSAGCKCPAHAFSENVASIDCEERINSLRKVGVGWGRAAAYYHSIHLQVYAPRVDALAEYFACVTSFRYATGVPRGLLIKVLRRWRLSIVSSIAIFVSFYGTARTRVDCEYFGIPVAWCTTRRDFLLIVERATLTL